MISDIVVLPILSINCNRNEIDSELILKFIIRLSIIWKVYIIIECIIIILDLILVWNVLIGLQL